MLKSFVQNNKMLIAGIAMILGSIVDALTNGADVRTAVLAGIGTLVMFLRSISAVGITAAGTVKKLAQKKFSIVCKGCLYDTVRNRALPLELRMPCNKCLIINSSAERLYYKSDNEFDDDDITIPR